MKRIDQFKDVGRRVIRCRDSGKKLRSLKEVLEWQAGCLTAQGQLGLLPMRTAFVRTSEKLSAGSRGMVPTQCEGSTSAGMKRVFCTMLGIEQLGSDMELQDGFRPGRMYRGHQECQVSRASRGGPDLPDARDGRLSEDGRISR